MMTSPDLPTAVDFNNILVNYIEISTEDIPRTERRASTQPSQKQPLYQLSPRYDDKDPHDYYSGTVTPGDTAGDSDFDELRPEEMPEGDFRQVMPQALRDIDLPEDDDRYKQAARVIQDSAAPPSLPLFLSRSILNGNLPVKDDGSVLALPNHTVLNHLMTSNVRNGVLATSVTTRYKKKVGRLIMSAMPCFKLLLTLPVVCDDNVVQACAETDPSTATRGCSGLKGTASRSRNDERSAVR